MKSATNRSSVRTRETERQKIGAEISLKAAQVHLLKQLKHS